MSSSDPREDNLLPPDVLPFDANSTLSVLQHAKLLSITTLCDIIRDPEQSAQDRRLAAVAILRYVAASEPRPRPPQVDAPEDNEYDNKEKNDRDDNAEDADLRPTSSGSKRASATSVWNRTLNIRSTRNNSRPSQSEVSGMGSFVTNSEIDTTFVPPQGARWSPADDALDLQRISATTKMQSPPALPESWLCATFGSERSANHLPPLNIRQASVLACAGSPTSLTTTRDTLAELLSIRPPRAGP